MVALLYCEFLKLKRSKMFFISLLGGLVTPVMEFADLVKITLTKPDSVITYFGMFDATILYLLELFGIIVYGVIAAYLFSREYTENTLKSVLTIPISKSKFLIAKYLMFFVWMLILTLESWVATLFLCIIGKAEGFSYALMLQSLKSYMLGSMLLYLTLSPFVFLTLLLKNIVPSVIAVTAATLGNMAVFNEDLSALYPWASPYLIASGEIKKYCYPTEIAFLIIVVVFLFGLFSSFYYFNRQDVK